MARDMATPRLQDRLLSTASHQPHPVIKLTPAEYFTQDYAEWQLSTRRLYLQWTINDMGCIKCNLYEHVVYYEGSAWGYALCMH